MKKILEMLRANINAQLSAIASQTTEEAKTLRTNLQGQLAEVAKLDSTAETDGAGIAAAAMGLLQRMQESATGLFNDLQTARTSLATATTQLNELNGKVTSGDLLPKDKVKEREELARGQGVESCAAEIASLRKQVVAGLPTPPDSVLKLSATEFNALITDARANLTKAGEKGLALDGTGKSFLARALWSKADAFATELASLESDGLLRKKGDPLLGHKDEDDNKEAAKPSMVGLC